MKILVTGGAGFIGSFLCETLVEKGHEVICLDNFFTGSKENIKHLIKNYKFELIRHDVIEPIFLEADRIYNLACPASPVHYQFNPIKTIQTNVCGTLNMLELANRVKARILQASTSEIYGDPEQHPQKEEYWGHVNCLGPRSCYDEGKRVAESLMVNYHLKENVDIRIVRIFNTYGPRLASNDGRVISNFILAALKNKPLIINGNGSQTRSFCYIDDLIEGLINAMEGQDNFQGPINLGNPKEHSIKELAELIIKLTNSRSAIEYAPSQTDDPTRRQPDITLAGKELNWKPNISIEEGLLRTIEYFKSIKKC
ncbi:UDP-glucuronic acid decarboxylase family protein [Candidatus Margulisiibacteriota bacterium]